MAMKYQHLQDWIDSGLLAEMRRLRFEEKLSFRKIGKQIGISHERVAQLMGRSIRARPQEPFLNNAGWLSQQRETKTCVEIANELGVPVHTVRVACQKHQIHGKNSRWDSHRLEVALRQWVVKYGKIVTYTNLHATDSGRLSSAVMKLGGYVYWRDKIGQSLSASSSVQIGRYFQNKAKIELEARGHEAQLMPWRHPFDILLDRKLRIEVKGSHRRTRNGDYGFCLRQSNGHDVDCDYLILGCEDENQKIVWYIIPESDIGSRTGLSVFPSSGRWQKYTGKWRILDQKI